MAAEHGLELVGHQGVHDRLNWGGGINQDGGAALGGVACGVARRGCRSVALPIHKNPEVSGNHLRASGIQGPEAADGWDWRVGDAIDGHAQALACAESGAAGQYWLELVGHQGVHDRLNWGSGIDQDGGAALGGVARGVPRGGHRGVALSVREGP